MAAQRHHNPMLHCVVIHIQQPLKNPPKHSHKLHHYSQENIKQCTQHASG